MKAATVPGVRRSGRAGVAVCVLFAALGVGLFAAPAAVAQDVDPVVPEVSVVDDGEAVEVVEPFDGRASEGTIDRVRRVLVAIAVATSVGLVAFWWHTSPARRLRVATQRAAENATPQD